MISALKLLNTLVVCSVIFLPSATESARCFLRRAFYLAWSVLNLSRRRSLYIISFLSFLRDWVGSSQEVSSFLTVSDDSLGQGEKGEMIGVSVLCGYIHSPLWGDLAVLDLLIFAATMFSSRLCSSALEDCSLINSLSAQISCLSCLFSSLQSLICSWQYSISSLWTSRSVLMNFSSSMRIYLFWCMRFGTLTSIVGGIRLWDLERPRAESREQSNFFHRSSCSLVTSLSKDAFFSCRIFIIYSWLLHLPLRAASSSHFSSQSYLQGR